LAAGYTSGFHSLEEGVSNYVKEYLVKALWFFWNLKA
jgi:hypothetical protein